MHFQNRLWLPVLQHCYPRKTDNCYNICKNNIRIYAGNLRTSSKEALYVEASLEKQTSRKNLKQFLITHDEGDENYCEKNVKTSRPVSACLRNIECRYVEKPQKPEENIFSHHLF